MSIDAKVETVYIDEDGGGYLDLIDRPNGGIAGQKKLYFDMAPEEVTGLNGLNIWGGSGFIMLGDIQIANRIGYTKIEFVNRKDFCKALSNYKA